MSLCGSAEAGALPWARCPASEPARGLSRSFTGKMGRFYVALDDAGQEGPCKEVQPEATVRGLSGSQVPALKNISCQLKGCCPQRKNRVHAFALERALHVYCASPAA